MLKVQENRFWSPEESKYAKDATMITRGGKYNLFGFVYACYNASHLECMGNSSPYKLSSSKKEDIEFLTKGCIHTPLSKKIWDLNMSNISTKEKFLQLKQLLESETTIKIKL